MFFFVVCIFKLGSVSEETTSYLSYSYLILSMPDKERGIIMLPTGQDKVYGVHGSPE